MSLRIDTTACEGQDPSLNFSMACAMWACGTPHLKTEADAEEFFIRYRMYVMSGNLLYTDNLLTWDQVKHFVGAHTNTSNDKMTPTQFGKLVAERLREAATSILNHQKEQE